MRIAWTLLFFSWCFTTMAGTKEVRYEHTDRSTPKMILNPNFKAVPGKGDGATALAYIKENWQMFGLEAQASNMKLKSSKSSTLGTHYEFVQMLNGLEIENAHIYVSVDQQGQVYKVYNTTHPGAKAEAPAAKYLMDAESAMELGWEHLGVTGALKGFPNAELCYHKKGNTFKLVHRVQLMVDEPMGDWRIAVDAITGEVHETLNRMIFHKHGAAKTQNTPPTANPNSRSDFAKAVQQLHQEQAKSAKTNKQGKRADGSGIIFDPDPRTTLMDDRLSDRDLNSAFTNAYVTRPLRDITENNGTFSLVGPYVEIADFDSPTEAPKTTNDGVWNFERGNFGFNEATTYFHLDNSQREIQAMGYTNIQNAPIRVDVNGLNSADQSVFRSPNQLIFGSGCVDDSEDADVILHEYGHAIQYAINPNVFLNAHEGAMGEGFGDYWAGSYSISRKNGYEFFPSKVFHWDGQFECWPGRALDKFDLVYDHSRAVYSDHQRITGGQSDELWATPLFQSLFELYRRGIPRSEVDNIVLEAQFGLGTNQKMRLVADSMIQTAQRMFPNGPHAQVFREYFANHGILDSTSTYSYVAAHVPPNRSETDWKSEIVLTNPNTTAVAVDSFVYEESNGSFSQISQNAYNLQPGETLTITPEGNAQRWVRFQSAQPISGTTFFKRRPSEALGTEQAGIPLLAETERSKDLILPHVPADRVNFWSGTVLVNPNNETVNLNIKLFGSEGNELPQSLLNPGVPTQLAPLQKWVTFISEGPGGVAGIFDDSQSQEKVSYVQFEGSNELGAFELFGYNSSTGAVATSGIIALPDQNRTFFPIRIGTGETDFSSFSILNPQGSAVDLKVSVYSNSNTKLAENTFSIGARSKHLGLNLKNGNFQYPLSTAGNINIDGSNAAWMIVEATAPLRIFELSGDSGRTILDGSAVIGSTTRTIFQNPRGRLQILQGTHAGTVVVNSYVNGSTTPTKQEFNLGAGESVNLEIPAGVNTTSMEVSGALFSANVVDNDATTGALTIVKGKQVEIGQNQGKFEIEVNDDHANEFAQASTATVDQAIEGRLDFAGDNDYFVVDIPQAGNINIFTSGDTDTQGILFDASEVQISGDPTSPGIDDGGDGRNFRISQAVSAGKHYVVVRGYQDSVGRYSLNINLTPSKNKAAALAKQPRLEDNKQATTKTSRK